MESLLLAPRRLNSAATDIFPDGPSRIGAGQWKTNKTLSDSRQLPKRADNGPQRLAHGSGRRSRQAHACRSYRAGAVREVRMFGGLCFMLNGNMVAGTSKRGLMVRVGKEREPDALARPGAKRMEMTGRPMEGYIFVDPPPSDDRSLQDWLALAVAFVKTLPPKLPKSESRRSRTK